MKIKETNLKGVLIIENEVFSDNRGFFKETYSKERFHDNGISLNFVQDNFSFSNKNVIRGLHFQKSNPQGKLVWCPYGSVLDIILDIDPVSETFGQYISVELSNERHLSVWIPPGYAHGFSVLSDNAMFCYKCTELYNPSDEAGIIWNDKDIRIDWRIDDPLVSSKDSNFPTLNDYFNK
jgi:dTDP-4-dehydrorhamnose 3,5-epimerase